MSKLLLIYLLLMATILFFAWASDRFHIGNNAAVTLPGPNVSPLQLEQMHIEDYKAFGTAVMLVSIVDNYSDCGLSRPGSLSKQMPPAGERVRIHPQYGIVYQYDFSRGFLVGGNLREGLRKHYFTLNLEEIVSQLNISFANYSIDAGFGTARIVDQQELTNGRIRLVIGRG